MSNKQIGIWQVYVNGEMYYETFYENDAIVEFESCVEENMGEVELVRILRTTRLNEIMYKNKDLDTTGKWRVHPTVEGIMGE